MPSIAICDSAREAAVVIKGGKDIAIVEGNIPFDYIFCEITFASEGLAKSVLGSLGWGSPIVEGSYWRVIVFGLTPAEVVARLRGVIG